MNEDAKKIEGRKRERWKFTKVRYIHQESLVAPVRMDVYLDYTDIAIDAIKPFVISIKSKEVADSFKSYFEALWKIAKK